jgi:hypothetical protein
MRMLGLSLLAAAATLSACAGPADPASADQATAYRTGSRIKQADVVRPNLTYYGADQLSRSPDQTVSGVIAHAVPTPVPPPPQ